MDIMWFMKEHSIVRLRELLEAKTKKLVRTKKVKAEGSLKHSISNVLKRASRRKLKPGRYYVDGVHIVVSADGNTKLECAHCGMEFGSASDYRAHQKQSH